MFVGIFGGTFDPPHDGHIHVAVTLKKLLQLREVWWIVTESNLLKSRGKYELKIRKELVRSVVSSYPGMRMKEISSPRGYEVVTRLRIMYPQHKFVWLGGTDNMVNMHAWHRGYDFAASIPIVLLERPGYVYCVYRSRFATAVPRIHSVGIFPLRKITYGWTIVRLRPSTESSTRIRALQEQ